MQSRLHGVVFGKFFFIALRKRRKGSILGSKLESIQPETINTLIGPKLHDIKNLLAHFGVFPVQIGLLAREIVQIIGIAYRIIHPGIMIYIEKTVARRRLASIRVPPMIVIAVRVGS